MIARPLAFAITGPLAGYIAVRIGERTSAVVGSAFVVASMVALAAVAPGSSDLIIVGSLALSGIGLGASSPAMAATIANAVDERDLGIAGAFQQMVQQLGVVIGKIGRAHVCTPVTNAHLVCRLLLEKKQ